jgi:beta-glucosidase
LRALVAQLTVDEKARLMTRYETPTAWEAPRIGLQPVKLSDGPAGVRPQAPGDCPLLTPCETALAASWNPDLLRRIGELVGDEARRRGVIGVYAPNVNLPRSPLGGRAFEQFAEDPLLTGVLASAWVQGLQSRHVASVVKHLAANDSETERQIMNSVVSERVLREVYLLPFELAVESGAWGIMSAYNRVNGVYCGEHEFLLSHVLKGEWHFDGFVISDAGGTRSTAPSALAGLDMELPGPGRPQRFGEPLADAVRAGEVPAEVVDAAVERILRLAERTGRLGDDAWTPPESLADPRALLLEAAAAGFVLLRNRDAALPLHGVRRLAVIGPNAAEPCYQGGAFSQLPLPESTETPLDALRAKFRTLEILHERGAPSSRKVPLLREVPLAVDGSPGVALEYFLTDTPPDAPLAREVRTSGSMVWLQMPGIGVPNRRGRVQLRSVLTPEATGVYTFVLGSSAGFDLLIDGQRAAGQAEPPPIDDMGSLIRPELVTFSRELRAGQPLQVRIDVHFGPARAHSLHFGIRPPTPADLLDRAVAAARAADAVVLVVGESQDSALESADRSTTHLTTEQEQLVQQVCAANDKTVLVLNAAHATDLACAEAAAAVLCVWFPGQEFGPALADVLAGDLEPGGRLPVTFARDEADYPVFDLTPVNHDLMYESEPTIGYRHFLTNGIAPRFAFGDGLGYTTFELSDLVISERRVSVKVRNTGGRAGKEVVQVYVRTPEEIGSGAIELKAFAPVWLQPGSTQTLEFTLDDRTFRHWTDGGWHIAPGDYEVLLGRSSVDLPLRGIVPVG